MFSGVTSADDRAVLQRLHERLPSERIERLSPTPYPGIYEFITNRGIHYTDEQVTWIMVGNLIDVKTGRNLTQQTLRKLTAIDWKLLPLDLAIRKVKGDGSRRLAVFSDPMCSHCVQIERELAKLDHVTIYTFLYPIERLHKGASALSRAIWCAPERARAWDAWMLERVQPRAKPCLDPLERIDALGTQLKIEQTPTLIFGDGTVVRGGLAAQQIEKLLAESGKN